LGGFFDPEARQKAIDAATQAASSGGDAQKAFTDALGGSSGSVSNVVESIPVVGPVIQKTFDPKAPTDLTKTDAYKATQDFNTQLAQQQAANGPSATPTVGKDPAAKTALTQSQQQQQGAQAA